MPVWSLGTLQTPRGAGLGNEIFAWAKAYIGGQITGARVVTPPWIINRRRYDRDLLGGGVVDALRYGMTSCLPRVDITEELYLSTGEIDYGRALLSLERRGKFDRPLLQHSSGMAGGYLAIRAARPFLRRELMGSSGALSELSQMAWRDSAVVRIGVHIRAGDFTRAESVRANAFNSTLPLDWYAKMVGSLVGKLRAPVEVLLTSDRVSDEMIDALTFKGVRPIVGEHGTTGDLALLSECDLIISSVSSFSLLAIFLSDARYVWHRDQLGEFGGWLSIWGHEEESASGRTSRAAGADRETGLKGLERGVAQGGSPKWTSELLQDLEGRAMLRNRLYDLHLGGVVESQ